MKIALLTDTHFGARNDNVNFNEYFYDFYEGLFFPYLQQNNIKHCIHLGDLMDRRKFVSYRILKDFRERFIQPFNHLKINLHILVGNHDIYFRNTNDINSLQELLGERHNNIHLYAEAQEVDFDGFPILMMPWINPQNEIYSFGMMDETKADTMMSHLEVVGFEMHGGHTSESGFDKEQFKKFDTVFSGHYHKKSDDGQIYYLGTQYEMMWSDYKDPKGFHIFDTDTRELTRVSNPMRIFRKIYYNDTMEDYDKVDISRFDKSFIKLFISNKTDEDMYNRFIQRIYDTLTVHDLNIFEDTTDVNTSVPETIEQGEDTTTFLNNYIDHIETDLDKGKIKEKIKELYQEANDGN